jgi:hypothetical protein
VRTLRAMRMLVSVFAVAALLGAACAEAAAPPAPTWRVPSAPPTSDLTRALEAARQRLQAFEDGKAPPPLVVAWEDVESGNWLNRQQNAAFCAALDRPGADDALAALVFMGLEAVSLRIRRKPLPDDMHDVLGVAATFATKSCPAWVPVVNPPTSAATPLASWYPAGYSIVHGDEDLVWQWSAPGSFACMDSRSCWQIDVLSRNGCMRVDGVLHVQGDDGLIVAIDESAVADVPAGVAIPMQFGLDVPAGTLGNLRYLTCIR